MRDPAKNQGGFTLAELLVATMLLAIVMTSVYTLFNSSIGSWRTVEAGFDAHQEARSFMSLFSHEFGNIAPRAGHLFEGENDSITLFVVSGPMNLEEGEGRRLMRVKYNYSRTKRAVMREEAFIDGPLPKLPPEGQSVDRGRIKVGKTFDAAVADNVTEFHIRYLWVPARENWDRLQPPEPLPPVIVERSEERWGLPQAVEILIEVADPEGRQEPYRLVSVFPIRVGNPRLTRADLDRLLGSAS
ncbi:MAG: prepilin-type N-terminal cleavage/methylation domain-containing protein [Candidatus Hydrogenedentes bacterium]|nr:prepilin-type N-terminal cleavage/methylation domain-containing protein [Candidatus Hydrogenedentota bacterium]